MGAICISMYDGGYIHLHVYKPVIEIFRRHSVNLPWSVDSGARPSFCPPSERETGRRREAQRERKKERRKTGREGKKDRNKENKKKRRKR